MSEDKVDKLVRENMGLVRLCANRLNGRGIEYDELFSAGSLGLCKAARGFDESRGVKFSTYAVPVILGEIRRLFRDGGQVKVSRPLKELSLRVTRERERILQSTGTEPTVARLAAALGESEEMITEAIASAQPALSLTEWDDDGEHQADIPTPAPDTGITDRIALYDAISRLDKQDRQLIFLRYFKNLTQSKTAAALGMTQVQVSRREKKIMQQLYATLNS
ncbi:sigma-70 family RNA polymerase sigma factor [Ruminococcus sp. NK3A76]|uniref:sigma-70 family RNA polymerase sigma factor n=1 Tax=Ruminococcus sp. NK3A76 TaxID=877411 RepID=UPI0004903647|nr:sigma-70 family RNA polymerase sigma factor [Ruminococcus sp. NK3A76]